MVAWVGALLTKWMDVSPLICKPQLFMTLTNAHVPSSPDLILEYSWRSGAKQEMKWHPTWLQDHRWYSRAVATLIKLFGWVELCQNWNGEMPAFWKIIHVILVWSREYTFLGTPIQSIVETNPPIVQSNSEVVLSGFSDHMYQVQSSTSCVSRPRTLHSIGWICLVYFLPGSAYKQQKGICTGESFGTCCEWMRQ